MTVKTILCDCCKAPDAQSVQYFVDRRMDAAGSMENEYESIDLCVKCMADLMRLLLNFRNVGSGRFSDVYIPQIRNFRKHTGV